MCIFTSSRSFISFLPLSLMEGLGSICCRNLYQPFRNRTVIITWLPLANVRLYCQLLTTVSNKVNINCVTCVIQAKRPQQQPRAKAVLLKEENWLVSGAVSILYRFETECKHVLTLGISLLKEGITGSVSCRTRKIAASREQEVGRPEHSEKSESQSGKETNIRTSQASIQTVGILHGT